MYTRLPLEKLNNDFEKQFMAMRYLLLGLIANRPDYKDALKALEASKPYVIAYRKTGEVDEGYRQKLLLAFDLYSRLAINLDGVEEMKQLLLPKFSTLATELADEELESSDGIQLEPLSTLTRAINEYTKLFVSMQYFLLGIKVHNPVYQVAYDALLFGAEVHVGVRKDGKTPEYQHQLEIAHHLRTLLPSMLFPAETLAAAFLHDTDEDYGVGRQKLLEKFGRRVTNAVLLLNKYEEDGKLKPTSVYYQQLGLDPIGSLVKPTDNGNNQSTMDGVFAHKKQFAYIHNIKHHSWPMLRVARKEFPEQEAAYENLKTFLRIQYNAVQALLTAAGFDPETGESRQVQPV